MWLKDLWGTLSTINLADILDIGFMACLLYLLLLWFKRTKAAFVARGILIFVLVYIVAQQAGMYLTTWLFQGFFAVFLIALVVIFQEELRSFFEKVAVWSLRRGQFSRALQPKKEVEILVRVASHFARSRIGALIVLKGKDPLQRHIEGGEDLDGRLSMPLLLSIFDPHSEGHDGAVIIEGNRVSRFGAHLPLSKEFGKLAGVGTRHTAALGLSERTDALCLVVSEERGVISIANDGDITVLKDLETLEERLTAFLKEQAPAKVEMRWWRDALKRNAAEKGIAATISFALWLVLVQGYRPASQVFRIPVEARAMPEELYVESIRPERVNVTLKGLKRELKMVNPLNLRVAVDLKQAKAGTQAVTISDNNLRLPETLQLANVDPPVIELDLAQIPDTPQPFLQLLKRNSMPELEPSEGGPGLRIP